MNQLSNNALCTRSHLPDESKLLYFSVDTQRSIANTLRMCFSTEGIGQTRGS